MINKQLIKELKTILNDEFGINEKDGVVAEVANYLINMFEVLIEVKTEIKTKNNPHIDYQIK